MAIVGRAQNVLMGVLCGGVAYMWTFKQVASHYQDVADDISRLHYEIQPNFRNQASVKGTRPNWFTGDPIPTETSTRTLKQAWNENVRTAFLHAAKHVL